MALPREFDRTGRELSSARGPIAIPTSGHRIFPAVNPLVVVATYNERTNVEFIIEKLLGLGTPLDILFVDDNSPDGTGILLDALAERNLSLRVLHRKAKDGIGSAHLAGLSWARENGYCTVVTMDCDMTHSPEDVPEIS